MSTNQPLSMMETTANPVQDSEPSVRFQISEVEQPLDEFEGSSFEACHCTGTGPVDQVVFVP
jgi:hypothetical protein